MAREMRGVDALEGPELGAIMAQAMQQRVRNNTTTAQRARSLRNMARGGPAGRAREEAAAAEAEAASEWWSNMRAMERMDERRIAEDLARQRMANAPGRGLQGNPNDPMNLAGGDPMWTDAQSLASQVNADPSYIQGPLGGTNAEEEALLAQMQADMANQAGPQGFTSEGYVPGGAGALPQATSVPQTPQVAGPTGSSQAGPQGFTSPGYVEGGAAALPQATSVPQEPQVAGSTGTSQAQQPNAQGFTSPGYVEGQQSGTEDNAALKWLNDLFKKDEQPQGGQPQDLQPFTPPGPQGFTSEGYVPGGPSALGGGMSPEEQQKLQQITQGLESSRPDQNADATVSWPTIGDQGAQTPGGFQSGSYNPDMAQLPGESFMDYTKRMHEMRYPSGGGSGANADEIIGSLLEKYGSQLKMAGYGEQLEKFSSGNYTKADIDGLIGQFGSRLPKDILAQLQQAADSMAAEEGAAAGTDAANVVVEELPGLDPNYAGQQGTTSSGSSQFTTQHGFGAKDYNPDVAIKPDETFMEYTKRMHKRIQERNREQQFQDLINEGTQRWYDQISPPA